MLLVRPGAQPNECLISYLIRVSEKNGFKHIGHFLHYAGLNWKNNRAPVHQILIGEFDLSPFLLPLGLPCFQSKIAPLYQSFQQSINTPYLLSKFPKVCSGCIEEMGCCDYKWSILPTIACIKHKKMLVDVHPDNGKRLSWYRQNLNPFDGESCVIKMGEGNVEPAIIQFSQYVESLICGCRVNESIPVVLQGLTFGEFLTMIHFVAHYQLRLSANAFNPVTMGNDELGQCYMHVWMMFQNWPDSFYALLNQYIDRPMSIKGVGGLNKHYRDLYERLHRQQSNQGISRIKDEFDRYIELYWPGVLEPERIKRIRLLSSARNIISKKETAKILSSRIERVDKLVQQKKLTQVFFKGKAHYLREQVEGLATTIISNWTMDEACEALQLTRDQVKQLLDADVVPTLQKPDSLNRDWVIDKAQFRILISKLSKKARKTRAPPGTLSLAGIQRQGYSIVQLILAMLAGEIEYEITHDLDHPDSFRQFSAFKCRLR